MNRLPFQQLLLEEENKIGGGLILQKTVAILHILKVRFQGVDEDADIFVVMDFMEEESILQKAIEFSKTVKNGYTKF